MKLQNIFLTLLLSISLPMLAETDAEILSKIAEKGRRVSSISCDFQQTKRVKALRSDVQSSGQFFYQSPDRVCMQYANPQGDLLLMNGNDFVMISGGQRSVANGQNNPMLRQMRQMLTACVSGDFSKLPLGKGGKMIVETTEKTYNITLVFEGSTKRYFSTIELKFWRKDLSLSVLRMNESNGNFTEYRFENVRIDPTIDEKVFDVKQ